MFCVKCGAALSEAANFCGSCGQRTAHDPGEVITIESPPPPAARTALPSAQEAGEPARYAGFWRRVAATFVDGLVQVGLGILLGVGLVILAAIGLIGDAQSDVLTSLLGVVIAWLYYALMHSGPRMATYGKRALHVKVVSLQGERISFARATGRYFAYVFFSYLFTLGIGLLMAAFTARKQALHDIMAGTLVVSDNTTPADIAAGLQPPKSSAGVVAVAVLAGLVPVVGILAAIAIPAYQDYVIRVQVAEGLTQAAPYKAAVAEAHANGIPLDEIASSTIGMDAAGGKYVDAIEVDSGTVFITYGGESNQHLRGRTLALVSGSTAEGDVVWMCGYASVPDGVTPAITAHRQYTDVEKKYLPSSCR